VGCERNIPVQEESLGKKGICPGEGRFLKKQLASKKRTRWEVGPAFIRRLLGKTTSSFQWGGVERGPLQNHVREDKN